MHYNTPVHTSVWLAKKQRQGIPRIFPEKPEDEVSQPVGEKAVNLHNKSS